MLRLGVTKAFANLMENSTNTSTVKQDETVDISAEINGFGPIFKMIVKIKTIWLVFWLRHHDCFSKH